MIFKVPSNLNLSVVLWYPGLCPLCTHSWGLLSWDPLPITLYQPSPWAWVGSQAWNANMCWLSGALRKLSSIFCGWWGSLNFEKGSYGVDVQGTCFEPLHGLQSCASSSLGFPLSGSIRPQEVAITAWTIFISLFFLINFILYYK